MKDTDSHEHGKKAPVDLTAPLQVKTIYDESPNLFWFCMKITTVFLIIANLSESEACLWWWWWWL